MPQVFQVLKCFKCSVFQVHQTKKSNKWECKLCGEKQSIKRHYGLGTGKECRLHVQKLNSIRGEVNEINETSKPNESSDEEIPKDISDKTQANFASKWSDFVDKIENVKVPEPEFIGNAEVVLEVPAKQRKIQRSRATKNQPISMALRKTDRFDNVYGSLQSQTTNVCESLSISNVTTIAKTNEDEVLKMIGNPRELLEPIVHKEIKAHLVPHKVDKSSKWAQFADESDAENDYCDNDLGYEKNTTNDGDGLSNNSNLGIFNINITGRTTPKNLPINIFSLCDENDLDDVLDF